MKLSSTNNLCCMVATYFNIILQYIKHKVASYSLQQNCSNASYVLHTCASYIASYHVSYFKASFALNFS